MCFRNVYCGEPGSFHDARVFRRSLLYETALTDKRILFPGETFLLGDSVYPSLPWLVPPFRDNGHLTPQQTEFNFIHSSTRITVEKAFGQLITFITNTVVAACILHNYCINKYDIYDFPEYNDDDCLNVANDNDEEFL